MTKLNWRDRNCGDGISRWTAKASRVVGGEYRVEGPILRDGGKARVYSIFYLGPRPKDGMLSGRYVEPAGATLAESIALAQADNDKIRRDREQNASENYPKPDPLG
jgi:hypothetical protein